MSDQDKVFKDDDKESSYYVLASQQGPILKYFYVGDIKKEHLSIELVDNIDKGTKFTYEGTAQNILERLKVDFAGVDFVTNASVLKVSEEVSRKFENLTV